MTNKMTIAMLAITTVLATPLAAAPPGGDQKPAPPPPSRGPGGPQAATPSSGHFQVTRATYGVSGKTCDASGWFRENAKGRASASVPVNNKMCGDPAPGAAKTLDVTYLCGSLAKTASGKEGSTVVVSCP